MAVVDIVAAGKEGRVWKRAEGLEELGCRWQWNSEGVRVLLVPVLFLITAEFRVEVNPFGIVISKALGRLQRM
jgi:hypothetical protein